jgi:hypothetical protein
MESTKTISEFCELEKLSKPKYFDLRKRGLGPREMRDGRWVRISPEAHADWRRAREQTTTNTD